MTEVLLLFAAGALVAACAVFVAAEFSLTTVENAAVERAAEAGERGAPIALKAVRRLTFQLSGAQLGITLTSLLIGMLAEPSVAALLHGPLSAAGLSERAADTTSLVLGIVLSTVVLMVFGELVPKNWAIAQPLPVAKLVAGPLYYFSKTFSPLIGHLNNTANRAVRRRGLEPAEHLGGPRSPEELVALVQHSSRGGVLDIETADMFIRVLRLRQLTAVRVMTPRVDIKALHSMATAQDVVDLTRQTGISQFPIYSDTLDYVDGIVHLKSALAVPANERATITVVGLALEPILVPESLAVDRLLDRLRDQDQLAVVLNEYGNTVGVVTLEDIVEEVIGSVSDEHDSLDSDPLVALGPTIDGRARWRADGMIRTDELDSLGLPGTDGPFDTLAGMIAEHLDRIPVPGDQIHLDDWSLDVQTVAHHVAESIQITGPLPPDGAAEASGSETLW